MTFSARRVLLICGLGLCSCIPTLREGARDGFVHSYSCPEQRVQLIDRPDLKAPGNRVEQAPPEIAADPERKKVWDHDHAPPDHPWYVFQLKGCDQDVYMQCTMVPCSETMEGANCPWPDCREFKPEG